MIPQINGGYALKGCEMQRVDGNYLYTVGYQIHPIASFKASQPGVPGTSFAEAWLPLVIAVSALEPLLSRSVFRLKTSVQAGQLLLNTIKGLREKADSLNPNSRLSTFLDDFDAWIVTDQLRTFENVLAAELAMLPLYVVTQKAGFDTSALMESGLVCFPLEIASRSPEAVHDFEQATKCLALEVFTAAGFHLHRGNEAVLRRYWDAVAKGTPRPKSRNIGDYLKIMDDKNFGNEKVRAALRHLKDFHRNPLIHPEHKIESANEAIALMNSVHTVLVEMLKEIPDVVAAPQAVPAGGIIPQITSGGAG
jgi:hypothetical protein